MECIHAKQLFTITTRRINLHFSKSRNYGRTVFALRQNIFYSATSFDGGSKTRQTDSPFTVMQWRRFDRYPETCNLHVLDKRFWLKFHARVSVESISSRSGVHNWCVMHCARACNVFSTFLQYSKSLVNRKSQLGKEKINLPPKKLESFEETRWPTFPVKTVWSFLMVVASNPF